MKARFIRYFASLWKSLWKRRSVSSTPSESFPLSRAANTPGFALEPRIMLDAALVSTGVETLSDTDVHQDQLPPSSDNQPEQSELTEALDAFIPPAMKNDVFLIDPSVPDYEMLLSEMPENAEVHILSSSATLTEIADVLANYQNLDAVHVLSHGGIGSLSLSGEIINSDSIESQQSTLAAIGQSLKQDGDILLYGCQIGNGNEGKAFIQQLAELTGADIAASDDLTGAVEKEGDWNLEAYAGEISSSVVGFESQDYQHTLDLTGASTQVEITLNGNPGLSAVDVVNEPSAATEFNLGNNILFDVDTIDSSTSRITITFPGGYDLSTTAQFESEFSGGVLENIISVAKNTDLTTSSDAIFASVTGTDKIITFFPDSDQATAGGLGVVVFDVISSSNAGPSAPAISSSNYDYSTGTIVVNGTDFVASSGALNDVDVTRLTLTGEDGATYTLTSSDVEITSATEFTITLNEADRTQVNGLLNKNGSSSDSGKTYNLAAADNWMRGADEATYIADLTGNGVTVSNVSAPVITSSTYDVSTGMLVVTGTGFVSASGAANDVDVSLLTFTGEGSRTYTLTSSSDVDITSATQFTITLSASDKLNVNGLLNKDGQSSDDTTTYNLAAADNWMTEAAASTDIADAAGNAITVSNVALPTITSATYNHSTGVLVVTGTNFVSVSGAANDVDISLFTFTGEGGITYTLTSGGDVDVTSATEFTITLSGGDKLHVNGLLNKTGTASDGGTTYNLAAADGWMQGSAATVDIADTLGNGITVSSMVTPTITSATYDASTGALVVIGSDLVRTSGADNDIDASLLTFTGEGGATYTLTSTSDVEITSATEFTIMLSAVDRLNINGLLNKDGTTSDDNTTYRLSAADNWAKGAGASRDIADGLNSITVSNVAVPTMTSAAYDASTGTLNVTGTGFVNANGVSNDVDVSLLTFTGEAGGTYTLTSGSDVEITSATSFTVTLTGADRSAVEALLNNNGTVSGDSSTYNLSAADNWMTGAAASATIADATNAITVSNYNEAPVVNTDLDNSSGGAAGYETGFAVGSSSGVAIVDADFTITDADDTDIQSAVISLSGALDGGAESLSIDGAPATVGAITITYTSGSQINLSGAATKAEYEAVIKQIKYANSASPGDVTPGDRTVAITVSDDGANNATSNTATSTVTVAYAPVVSTGADATFTENNANTPVSVVDATASIVDDDSTQLSGMVIDLTNAKADDLISLNGRNDGDTVNGITITYNSDTRITLSGTTTRADYLTLLKALQFVNSSDNPDTTDRTIAIATTDAENFTGNATATVSVVASDDPSVISGVITGSVNEGNVGDSAATDSGALIITDIDTGDSPYFDDQGATTGDNSYGAFALLSETWTYTLDQSTVQSMNVGDSVTDKITYIASDGNEVVITVTINGTNDAAVLSSADVSLTETNAPLSTSGTLTNSDVDDANTFVSQNNVSGTNGTFGIDANGNWTYVANSVFDHLNTGNNVSDTFTVTATDGTQTTGKVTISGSNDAAVLSSADVSLTETNAPLATSGTLTNSDVDNANTFQPQNNVSGSNGTFSIDANGHWNYVANSAFDSLNSGDSLSDTFTVTATDGTQTSIKVTINGSNDDAVLSSADVSLTESNAPLNTSGTLTNNDVDNATTFQPRNNVAGSYGTFTIDANGHWSYVASSALDSLDTGDSVSDTFTVTASDGSLTQVKVTVNGSNDVAVVSGTVSGSVTEGNEGDSPAMATGSLTITDVDGDDNPDFTDQGITEGNNGYGFFVLNGGVWTYTLNQATVQNLDEGDTLTDTITYTATDGTTQLITVTITGKDEPIVVSPPEDNSPDSVEVAYETSPEPGIPDPLTTTDGSLLAGFGQGLAVESPTSDVKPGAGSPAEALAGDNGLVTSAQTGVPAFAVQGLFNQQNVLDARYGGGLITDSSGLVNADPSLTSSSGQTPGDIAVEFEAELGEEVEFNEPGQQDGNDLQQPIPVDKELIEQQPLEDEKVSSAHDNPVQAFSTQLALAVDELQTDMKKLDEALMHLVRAEDS